MNSVWCWIDPKTVGEVHDHQVAGHGGLKGVRNDGAVESALARPKNLAVYGDQDAAAPAASYAWGIARNHGFIDGNERTAWVTARLFLCDNGRTLSIDNAEAIQIMEGVADGKVTEQELADWFRKNIR